ncbi:hypothetical protein VB711_08860 [Cronbergia sp. UHCC 0137]|uniref:hypothetical protein n=1 Tax=Cronbergia sp. UHCC 0137 TaxID=3110239 RepID=UPI002B1F076D|nr:hypothetical protein [Cronbergia sp. UHCC 0137]MEA5617947.1 hypothetical protein [Cronbergia sp. UHCC 0137]
MVFTFNKFHPLNPNWQQDIPNDLQFLFERIRLEHYEELYEPEADGTASLQDTLTEVLELLRDKNQTITHLRYLWMTLIITLVVEPTLQYYQPGNSRPRDIIMFIASYILAIVNGSINNYDNNIKSRFLSLSKTVSENRNYSIEKEIANFQILDEAIDVFDNAIRVCDYEQAVEAILNILDDCLEGYAIFPGSYGRRELFDWWLLDVVPASYNLLPPKSFYVVEGVKNKDKMKLLHLPSFSLLNQISSEIHNITLQQAI